MGNGKRASPVRNTISVSYVTVIMSRQSIDWATELLERKIGELVRKNPLPEPKIDLDSAINKAEAADRKGKTAEDVLKLDMAINLAKVLSADAKTSNEALAIEIGRAHV